MPQEPGDGTPGPPDDRFSIWVVYIAGAILLSVFFLIGAAIIGADKGLVLTSMSRPEFARGLITYLFAVVTIGTAVVLVVSALTGPDDPHTDKRFQRGKEIMSLLLGVFGTIVGYYFGSEVSKGAEALRLAPLRIVRVSATKATVMTVVTGGQGPYQYAIAVADSASIDKTDFGPDAVLVGDGWITKDIDLPAAAAGQSFSVKVRVRDAAARSITSTGPIPPPPSP